LTRHYTLEEWKALSDEERNKIRNARNSAKKEREKQGKQPKVTIRINAMYLQLPLLTLMKMKLNKRLMFMQVMWKK
jgi:hypothetical protein